MISCILFYKSWNTCTWTYTFDILTAFPEKKSGGRPYSNRSVVVHQTGKLRLTAHLRCHGHMTSIWPQHAQKRMDIPSYSTLWSNTAMMMIMMIMMMMMMMMMMMAFRCYLSTTCLKIPEQRREVSHLIPRMEKTLYKLYSISLSRSLSLMDR